MPNLGGPSVEILLGLFILFIYIIFIFLYIYYILFIYIILYYLGNITSVLEA
jgi:hypothetical protein